MVLGCCFLVKTNERELGTPLICLWAPGTGLTCFENESHIISLFRYDSSFTLTIFYRKWRLRPLILPSGVLVGRTTIPELSTHSPPRYTNIKIRYWSFRMGTSKFFWHHITNPSEQMTPRNPFRAIIEQMAAGSCSKIAPDDSTIP